MLNGDPDLARRSDFTLDEHQQARQPLIDEGLSEEQAARSLAALWTVNNNADKERWNDQQDRLDAARRQEVEEEQRQQNLKDEETAARLEERKKNKNKYSTLFHNAYVSNV
jgi:hypothetical protein